MKKFLTIGLITITMLQTTIAQRIKGSDTVLPLAQKESESYMKARPDQSNRYRRW